MLLVTFHGGKPRKDPTRNNVRAFDKDGRQISAAVLGDAPGVLLDELRALTYQSKLLYVVNANQKQNNVLCYQGSGTKFTYSGVFVSHQTCPGVLHPFDLTFDGAGFCYISSQDTNLVTRLSVNNKGTTATPAPVAPALAGQGTFPPGTFVASTVAKLGDPGTSACPAPAGLGYSGTGLKKHSVRGVLWTNNALYVADQAAGTVKVYGSDGSLLGQSNQVSSPTHLSAHGGQLYVSGASEIFSCKLGKPGDVQLAAVPGLRIKNTGCMAFTKGGKVYVASRTTNTIYKFDSKFNPLPFNCQTDDNPEFLLHLPSH